MSFPINYRTHLNAGPLNGGPLIVFDENVANFRTRLLRSRSSKKYMLIWFWKREISSFHCNLPQASSSFRKKVIQPQKNYTSFSTTFLAQLTLTFRPEVTEKLCSHMLSRREIPPTTGNFLYHIGQVEQKIWVSKKNNYFFWFTSICLGFHHRHPSRCRPPGPVTGSGRHLAPGRAYGPWRSRQRRGPRWRNSA